MSIGSIGGGCNAWQWPTQAAQGSTASGTTSATASTSASGTIGNTGSIAATANVSSYLAAFSADLQSMLTQLGSSADTTSTSTAASGTSASGTANQTTANQPSGEVHHHHHHHGGSEGGSVQNAADQLAGEIAQSVQGTLTTGQIDQSASLFATDVMQALKSYGTTAAAAPDSAILA